jgi:hypothetical protein
MKNLIKSKIKATDGYTLYEIPNVDNVMIAIHGDYICLVGLDPRDIWFRLGDRPDLKPDVLKDFGLTSRRDCTKAEMETFIEKVLNVFA